MDKQKSKILSDALKGVIPIAVPFAAKFIINMVPDNSKLEDFLKNYKNYWEKVAPTLSTIVMQLTNAPEFVDDIVAELSAEVARAIKEKYSDEDGNLKVSRGSKKEMVRVVSAMALLKKAQFTKLISLINSRDVSIKQRKDILNFEVSPNQDEAIKFVATLSLLTQDQFNDWVALISPILPPKEKTELEKKLSEGWNDFQTDANKFFAKDSLVTRIAKQKGLM